MFGDASSRVPELEPWSREDGSSARGSDGSLAVQARSEVVRDRAFAAQHVETPLTTLLRLAEDPAAQVRAAVARNERADIPGEIREALARDRSSEVVFAVLRCEATPDAVLEAIAHGKRGDTRSAARDQLKHRKALGIAVNYVRFS